MVAKKVKRSSLIIICTIDRNGNFRFVSETFKIVIGYDKKELTNRKVDDFVHPNDRDAAVKARQEIIKESKTTYFENRFIHKSGKEVAIQWSVVWSEEDEVFFCTGREATEQKQVEQNEGTIEVGSDLISLLDKDLNFIRSGTCTLKELGYQSEELNGTNAFDLVHPDDISKVRDSISKVLKSKGYIKIPQFRFKDAKGEWNWIEVMLSNELHNPAVKALIASSRNITESINNRRRLQESKQKFQSLFDHHIDIVLFQNKEGVIINVNPVTLSFFGVQRKDIINRQFSILFPPEIVPLCRQTLQKALNGESVKFQIEIPFKEKGVFTFDVIKMPVEMDGEIIGAYSILRDITVISRSNHTIRRQAERMNTILESITDAFFTLDKDWNFTYANRELERLFRIGREELLKKNIWKLSQVPRNEELYLQFQNTIETGKAVHFEVYFEMLEKWLNVKAFPSEEGLSVFINDITEGVKSKQELEKLSLVASKTTNGVVIMNAAGVAEWVNEGFERLTGYTSSEVVGRRPDHLLQRRITDKTAVQLIRENRKKAKPFTKEMLVYKKSGEKVWLLIDVTPVLNENGEITKLIAIQTDITERKEAEESRLQMTNDLFKQNRDLQQFTYIVSHNLRSPVASIMGLAELLTTTVDKDSETYDVSLGYLKKSADQLDTVLRDLNQILSIRNKKAASTNDYVELGPVIQQVLATFKESLNECEGNVYMDIEEGISVHGNKAYLYSIFYNLLSNSIKYRSPNRSLEVSINCSTSDSGVVISFSDNGIGFDVEKVGDNIFKLYKRFHTNLEGRGVGLFLAKTHVEAMDGHIEVNSQVNVGTTFLIYLK